MTATEIARRSDALYHDYVIHRDLCDMVAQREAEIEKLRELVADMWPFVKGAMDDEWCPAPECPFTEPCTKNQVCMASGGFHYRMCELGVEV